VGGFAAQAIEISGGTRTGNGYDGRRCRELRELVRWVCVGVSRVCGVIYWIGFAIASRWVGGGDLINPSASKHIGARKFTEEEEEGDSAPPTGYVHVASRSLHDSLITTRMTCQDQQVVFSSLFVAHMAWLMSGDDAAFHVAAHP
jgi:hypothetical protein